MSLPVLITLAATESKSSSTAAHLAAMLIESHRLTADAITEAKAAKAREIEAQKALAEALARPPAPCTETGISLPTVFLVGAGGVLLGVVVGGVLALSSR